MYVQGCAFLFYVSMCLKVWANATLRGRPGRRRGPVPAAPVGLLHLLQFVHVHVLQRQMQLLAEQPLRPGGELLPHPKPAAASADFRDDRWGIWMMHIRTEVHY
jgi:hypothetical protein